MTAEGEVYISPLSGVEKAAPDFVAYTEILTMSERPDRPYLTGKRCFSFGNTADFWSCGRLLSFHNTWQREGCFSFVDR